MKTMLSFFASFLFSLAGFLPGKLACAQALPITSGEIPGAAAIAEAAQGVSGFVRRKVRAGLFKGGHRLGDAGAIAVAVLRESARFGFDPVLLLAVIEHESGFSKRVRGRHGEIGLMQIKPSTAKWMASRSGVSYDGEQTLEDPGKNIRVGAAYLAFLRDRFARHGHHYLAAYNMGQGNALRALRQRLGHGPYARHVIRRYHRLNTELAFGGWV